MAVTGGTAERLEDVPAHVWRSLPGHLDLGPSAVNPSRVGVWATKVIPKGKRFGPFVGEKKKRSQVASNVYMWEVYFPARGWMCVDATDPMKGNWLRYVNWARSSQEQNLFPLEINRAIYYKVLRPIGPGEELLVWYTVEDNPEITAALEEERAHSLSRKNSPRAKRARRKLQEKARQSGLGGFTKTSATKPTVGEMWDGGEGVKEEDGRNHVTSQEPREVHHFQRKASKDVQDTSMMSGKEEEEEGDEEDEEEEDEGDDQSSQPLRVLTKRSSGSAQSHKDSQMDETDPDFDPEADLDGDPHGESYPCPHCERRFSTRQGLERHTHIHGISNQQAQFFKCRYCNKAFGSQVGRRRHERRHESGSKKVLGPLAVAASVHSPVVPTDSSPDCTISPAHYIAIGSQFAGGQLQNSDMQRKESGPHMDRLPSMEENGESKELHPCKYCNKAFGTHTNMRRHQRRIHERHLLPKGVRRKGILFQEASVRRPGESPGTSPPPVYVPSADTEDEADMDDYGIDISKNISENLSFYIDGKIVSTSAVSSCEVIEVDTRSAALFGLDTVIISPNQITQALKVEGRTSSSKQSCSGELPAAKRRTSTPPLVTGLKVETDSMPSPSSSTSSSSNLIVGGLFQQAADSATLQREKTVYLSPKLKQLLQTKDFQTSTIALITESSRLAAPSTVTSLQGKFKRRTGSPPSSPQLSPVGKAEICRLEVANTHILKVPKLESHSVPPPENMVEKDERDTQSPSDITSQPSSGSGGNSCNQQPLDLSSSVSRRIESSNKVPVDSALDLSFNRRPAAEPEPKGSASLQPLLKKKKPNTSMLEKVLMNEYAGLTLPAEEGPSSLANLSCFSSQSPSVASEHTHLSPPSLTPVTLNPASPGTCSVTSPTPPPPVLPTIPSPPTLPGSPLSQPSDSPAPRSLPVLSPKMSPNSLDCKLESDPMESFFSDKSKDEDESHNSEPQDSQNTSSEVPPDQSLSSPPEPLPEELLTKSNKVSLAASGKSLLNGSFDQDDVEETKMSLKIDSDVFPGEKELSHSKPSPFNLYETSPHRSQTLPQIKVKEEPCEAEKSGLNHAPKAAGDSPPQPAAHDDATEMEDMVYSKTFVCNVCQESFGSMKELSGHITEHAAAWPFKCEFCVQLFSDEAAVLDHRTTLHGVGQIFLCSVCSKEFAFLCNLLQHQKDLHPNEPCTHTTIENGKLRPQNYTDPSRAKEESAPSTPAPETTDDAASHSSPEKAKEKDVNGNHTEDPNAELYTTIKIMASEGGKPKGPDVRLGINQHYPSFKPPPFPYHSRSHSGSVASATNFTTHNIPQTFSTAIRCTKCGNGFDNMPELHKHILVCANASDKKRYTPKKNPIPLKQIVKSPNGVVSPAASSPGPSAFRRMGQPKRLNFSLEGGRMKMSALSKKKNQLVQKAISQKNKAATTSKKAAATAVKAVKAEEEQPSNICPHCGREFTYTASLTKHMTVSCPMKPTAVKKGKKVPAEVKKEPVPVGEKNGRKKAPDDGAQTEPGAKPLGKTRTRSSGAADPETSTQSRGKAPAAAGRLKRPSSFPAPVADGKKPKKGQSQSLPPTPSAPDTPSDAAQRPAMRMQRAGKEPAAKRSAEVKSPQKPAQQKPPPRSRERVGGPVTRRSQMAAAAPAEVKPEEPHEARDSQEVAMK